MLDPAMGPCKRTMATRQIRKIKKQRFDEARQVETLPGDRGQVFEKMSAQSFYPHDVENLHGASLLQWIDTAGKDLVAELSIVEHHVHATSFIERLLSVDYPPIEDIVRCNVPVALIALCEICKSDPHGQNAINVATTCLNIFTKIASTGHEKSGFPSIYDSIYHALAIHEKAVFLTADKRHYEKSKSFGHICLLKDWENLFVDVENWLG